MVAVPFDFADINAIPVGALSRSEILKDGASAIYGSDAVAGVVNFILLNGPGEAPYEGAEVDFLYGNTTDTDARVLQTWVRGGVATEKVSIAAAAEYYDRDAIFSRDRDIACQSGQALPRRRQHRQPDASLVALLPDHPAGRPQATARRS